MVLQSKRSRTPSPTSPNRSDIAADYSSAQARLSSPPRKLAQSVAAQARAAPCRCDRAPIRGCDRLIETREAFDLLAGVGKGKQRRPRVGSTGALSAVLAPGSGGAVSAHGRLLRGGQRFESPLLHQKTIENRNSLSFNRRAGKTQAEE